MPETSQRVRVELGNRAYDIDIGPGQMTHLAARLLERGRYSQAVVIGDQTTAQLFGDDICRQLEESGIPARPLVVPPGEDSKSVGMANQLWEQLLEAGADRQTLVVAVGGGVVGDLAGFVAATFARGIRFCQVPTSLLAQVDSSVGGKVGINLPGAKNMVGAFFQPLYVLIDVDALATLPSREFAAGMAEVVKYGVIADESFFDRIASQVDAILARESRLLTELIARCCQIKAEVVSLDEREETGHRAILNYGHTVGHAIEKVAGYGEFLHGEAISIGMHVAARLAAETGLVSPDLVRRQRDLLVRLGLPVQFRDLDVPEILAAIQRDKKIKDGKVRFVLPTRMGHVDLVEIASLVRVAELLRADDQ